MPALPMQLLLSRRPGWRRCPVAVVAEDKPQGEILWVNGRARECRVRVGHRYAEGLSLTADLRADVVDAREIGGAVDRLVRQLRKFTPEVEPSVEEPGVFWLNASGFEHQQAGLFPSLEAWARRIQDDLRGTGFFVSVVVGFDRFNTYAVARQSNTQDRVRTQVFDAATAERRAAGQVSLDRLHFEPKLRDSLARLGVETVGDLRRLPASGMQSRFGKASYLLHRLTTGTLPAPLSPTPEIEPVCERFEIEPDQHEIDMTSLLFLLKQRLARMQQVLAERGEAVAGLHLQLLLDRASPSEHVIEPAEPTLDEVQLIDLLRLRLDASSTASPVVGFELRVTGVPATPKQLQLFTEKQKRDLPAANRALARLRAEFGDDAVVQAVLRDGHLPEAKFRWEPLRELVKARPVEKSTLRLCRRLLARPILLACQRAVPDGWFVFGLAAGPVHAMTGPYLVSGGWWRRAQHREYYFVETRRGDVLWIYFDRQRRRWYLHGVVD